MPTVGDRCWIWDIISRVWPDRRRTARDYVREGRIEGQTRTSWIVGGDRFDKSRYGVPSVLASLSHRGKKNDPSFFSLSAQAHLTPAQARELAQALLNAADFVEGKDGAK